MATAKKLPSGNYRVIVYDYTDENKKRHYKSFTAPTKKEAELKALTSKNKNKSDITLLDAIDKYCDAKKNVLSPATIRGYKSYKHTIKPIGDTKLAKIDYTALQGYINYISDSKSPKTVRNIHGLIRAVLKYNKCDIDDNVALPAKKKNTYVIPTQKDIQELLEYTKENDFELYKAICLGAIGLMRRSEICALTAGDIEGNTIHICKSVVLDDNNNWITKEHTKTYTSDRYVTVPQDVIDILPKKGKLVDVTPSYVSERFKRLVVKLGMKDFSFHDCRHFGASLMHSIGIPDQYIMLQGGWSNDGVLKDVYRNTLDDYQKLFEQKAESQFKKLL